MQDNAKLLTRLRRDTSGNTFMMSAVALIPLIAMIGGGVDMSIAFMARGKLQNACDAAALAGRQAMEGSSWDNEARQTATRFFNFNFPDGTLGAENIVFKLEPDQTDNNELIGSASAKIPTALMRVFGYNDIGINVECNAKRDLGHNDIVLVLDVTGSMASSPSSGGASKISRLRSGALELYRALDQDNDSITRYGIVPYSITVNVGRSLKNKDILRDQPYVERQCNSSSCWWGSKIVHIEDSSWNNGNDNGGNGNGNGNSTGNGNGASGGGGGGGTGNTEGFRTSGDACIEERPTVGNSMSPFRINTTVSRADIDTQAGNAGNDEELQFGRYDPGVQEGYDGNTHSVACPSEATKLQTYASESTFQGAINSATSRVKGYTYHDIGMLWGTRFISRTGFFAADNPLDWDGIPIRQHIVFMTDGEQVTADGAYTAYGVQRHQNRVQGSGSLASRHITRFQSICNTARSMGVTVWVIALDVTDTDDVSPCATSPSHFYTSDGSDLEEVFEKIGQGIGNLRLTR